MAARIAVAIEQAPKRSFALAIDWPGWARSGKDPPAAVRALTDAAVRYAIVARAAGESFPVGELECVVVETNEGGSGTDFGVPSRVTNADRRPTSAAEAERLVRLLAVAWARFETVAEAAPESLHKGPRGGGRDTSKIVAHVIESDWYYAKEIGVRIRQPSPADPGAIAAMRDAMLEVLARQSDGSPLAGRTWTARYAAARIAWHALDHAWEIEDRSEPRAG
ncbi:MAG TPA: hypothetical protein VLS28_05170 [Candidatus Sulfomarinibacteraceae bacterium]|nr:hypothetical protein [Candidatus Sulfomarinibacteraceae bacterium]